MRWLKAFVVLLFAALGSCGPNDGATVLESADAGAGGAGNSEASDDASAWWQGLPRPAWGPFERIAISQAGDWFQVHRIRDGIFAIYEDGQFEEVISYLIVGQQRALLLDTGLGVGNIAAVVEQLSDQPVVVLNTHSHYDHVGGNYQFDTVYGLDLSYSAEHARGRPTSEVARFLAADWVWKPLPEGVTAENYRSRPYQISAFVGDGDVLDLGGVSLEILTVPGHSPDSLVVLDRARRLLFAGDSFYPGTLYAHLPDVNFEDYQRSAEKLAGLRDAVDFILPGHNEPLLPSYYLTAMRDAFTAIQAPNAPYELRDGSRVYTAFEGFSIRVSEPPAWQDQALEE